MSRWDDEADIQKKPATLLTLSLEWSNEDRSFGRCFFSLKLGRCPDELNQEKGKHSKTGSRPFGEGWSSKATAVAGTLGPIKYSKPNETHSKNPWKKITNLHKMLLWLQNIWSLRPLIFLGSRWLEGDFLELDSWLNATLVYVNSAVTGLCTKVCCSPKMGVCQNLGGPRIC